MTLRLTSRFVLFFGVFAAAVVTAIGTLAYRSGSRSLEDNTGSQVLAIALEKEAALNDTLGERLNSIRRLAARASMVETAAALGRAVTPEHARAARQRLLADLLPYTEPPAADFVELAVAAPDTGRIVVSTNAAQEGILARSDARADADRQGPWLHGPYYSPALKAPIITIAAPVLSASGTLLAVVHAHLGLAAINAIVQRRTGREASEDVFLFNRNGQPITQPRFIGQPAVLQQPLDTPPIRRCIAEGSGVMLAHDYRGVPVITACRWNARYDFGLLATLSQAEAFAAANALGWSIAEVGLVVLCLSAVLALWLARRITRPVRRLHDKVKRFQAGDYAEHLPESGGDELAHLAHEFNRMASAMAAKDAELRQLATELEERVRQRTAELAQAQALAEIGSTEWDLTQGTMSWSDQMFRLLGLPPQDSVPSHELYLAGVHPDDRAPVVEWVAALLDPTRSAESDHRIVRPDGDVRSVRARATRVLDRAGEVSRIVATFQDVTAQKRSEDRFERLMESAPDAMLVVGRDGRMLIVNSQAEQLFGYTREELLGQNIDMLVPARFTSHAGLRDRFFAAAEPRPMGSKRELHARHKDGREIPVEISLSPMATDDGPLAIAAIRDVTPRQQVEAELRQARREAETANRAKSEFLATMSHEIRTPMNGVIGAIGLLADGDLTPHQHELASMAQSSAHTLLSIINDILDISKIEAGKMPIEQIPFDLLATLEEVGEMFAARADERRLELVLRYVPGTRRRFVGDPSRVRQVLVNLVGNAIKFSERGHVLVTIAETPGDAPAPAMVRVTVEDSGVGIAPEAAARLFERFSQADASTTRRFGGTGLGLAICKRLVELMGGEIGVMSRVGEGSTFWFTLPLALDPDAVPTPVPTPANMAAARVLVVDDSPASCRMLDEQIQAWHMRSDSATSAQAALGLLHAAAAAGDRYHIVIIDHHMPGIDGTAFAKAVKAHPALRDLMLVVLLSPRERHVEDLLVEGGFAGWLVKPVRPSALFDRLITACASQAGGFIPPAEVAPPRARPRFRGRVLVADDNATNQRVAQLALEGLGCTVDLVGTGMDALARLAEHQYDLVLMDCEMPGMDGFQATDAVRRLEAQSPEPRPRLPIVAMTAKALAGDREKCLAAGMDDYLSKPVQLRTLIETLRRWLPVETPLMAGPPAAPLPPAGRPQAAAPGTEPGALDESALNQLRALARDTSPSLFADVMHAFRDDAGRHLIAIQEAAARTDLTALRRSGHALKGASLNIGATSLASLALRLESLEEDSAGALPALLVQLQSDLARVEAAIDWELDQADPVADRCR